VQCERLAFGAMLDCRGLGGWIRHLLGSDLECRTLDPSMRTATSVTRFPLSLLAGAIACLCAASCSDTRREGDADGVPVVFTVQAESAFFSWMTDRRTSTVTGVGVGTSGMRSGVGLGVGVGFTGTEIYLLGHEQANRPFLFRRRLSYGDNTFTIPLRPGRTLVLTAQAEGGREGSETVGEIVIPTTAAPTVRVSLTKDGAKVETGPPATAEAPQQK